MKQMPQNGPGSGKPSTESLDSISPVELADALEQALDSMTEETYDPQLIDAYLDALEQKAPIPEKPDAEAAFQDFKRRFQAISFDDNSASDNKSGRAPVIRYPLKRVVVTIAATVALLFALMVGAQAAGIDVFGHFVRWTDEHFFFIFSSNEDARNIENRDIFQKALAECDLPAELAPSWYPDGFTAGDPEVWTDEFGTAVNVAFSNEEGKVFVVSISQYYEIKSQAFPFERDTNPVEAYTSQNRTFYIMSNIKTLTAAWVDDNTVMSIMGPLSVDEAKKMINSMGG